MVEWTILNLGQISRNRYWGEADDRVYRPGICNGIVLRDEKQNILVDPPFSDEEMLRILDSHAGLKARDIHTVFITHGHVDHAMGAAEFENVYMSHEDDYIYEKHGTDAFRRSCFSMVTPPFEAGEEDLIPTMKLSEIKNLKEGDRFDLGGISVEIYACPGHTRGSVVMLIPEERLLITGDACNLFTFVYDDYSTTITEYEESLKALLEKVGGKYDNVLLSHGDGNGYPELIEDVIQVCEDIKAGRADDIPFEFLGTTGLVAKAVDPSRGERGNIVYNKDRI